MGRNCEQRNEALFQCLPDCSGHGRFDQEMGKCDCNNKWAGRDCNISEYKTYNFINIFLLFGLSGMKTTFISM
jgi:hypothetical protein